MWPFKREPLLETVEIGDVTVIAVQKAQVRGRDMGAMQLVEQRIAQGATRLIIDISKLRRLKGRNIGELLQCYGRARSARVDLVIVKPAADTPAGKFWKLEGLEALSGGNDAIVCSTREWALQLIQGRAGYQLPKVSTTIHKERHGGVVVLRCLGPSFSDHEALYEAVEGIDLQEERKIVIDFSHAEHFRAACVGTALSRAINVNRAGGKLVIVAGDSPVWDVLNLDRLRGNLSDAGPEAPRIFDTLDEALEFLRDR
jgi:anti-anti-sigma regulatory factor